MERLASGPSTYVDYACTPQAIERVVQVLRGEYPGQRLVVVFGCGGDRDRVKRGPMGQAALAADAAVLTNDNPRSEAPEAIVADVLAACPEDAAIEVVLDRGEAIRRARELAGVDGVVAVLGKGHETTQTIGDQVLPWDDRAVVRGLA
jgi:UDP-N-acetylmuramoyl-L-alanyl-D-glutamate--2,6-diaminopimelate ligase